MKDILRLKGIQGARIQIGLKENWNVLFPPHNITNGSLTVPPI